ncbi:MAG TPA: Type 1 glutamine amidotransferase-like domain-containing protein [Candidatus Saccharimonadales bacterium]|nr:Type 1 glutamine amidotransferase-like domain-containing protein [Candidatus Saccharimonadales bacterium]
MRLLLTSNGLSNKSIVNAFVGLVGKPAKQIKVAFIPTAAMAEQNSKNWLIDDLYRIKQLGCSVDIIDLAQLTKEEWQQRVKPCDVIFVGGGSTFYLSYWMQKSGFFEALPKLLKTKVYAGISAGSIITGQTMRVTTEALEGIGVLTEDEYEDLGPKGRSSSKTLGFVNFNLRPHLNSKQNHKVRSEKFIKKIAGSFDGPLYAFDDASAIQVVDGRVKVISEGKWLLLNEAE